MGVGEIRARYAARARRPAAPTAAQAARLVVGLAVGTVLVVGTLIHPRERQDIHYWAVIPRNFLVQIIDMELLLPTIHKPAGYPPANSGMQWQQQRFQQDRKHCTLKCQSVYHGPSPRSHVSRAARRREDQGPALRTPPEACELQVVRPFVAGTPAAAPGPNPPNPATGPTKTPRAANTYGPCLAIRQT
jgi:hypothetical protein